MLKKLSFFKIWNKFLLLFFVFLSAPVAFGVGSDQCAGGCSGTDCACSSHLEGTKILLASGNGEIKIEKIKIGDTLVGFDTSLNMVVSNTVTSIKESYRDRIYIIETEGNSLSLTENHPIYVGEKKREDQSYVGYKRADSLRLGEDVFFINTNSKLSKKIINKIIVIEGDKKVYTITTSGTSNYFANGLLVHNKFCYDPCGLYNYCGNGDYCRICSCRECQTLQSCGWTNWDCKQDTCRECATLQCGWTNWDCKADTCLECASQQSCGWTNWNCKARTCIECEDCVPNCGQAKDCGGNCLNTDNGARAVPGLVSPLGTEADPAFVYVLNVPLDWNAVTGAEKYQARVLNSSGTQVWISGEITNTSATSGTLQWGKIYHWQARSINTTCDADYSAWSTSQYFMTDYVPTLEGITLKNSSGTIVPPDTQGRNNICQEEFYYDVNPRTVIVEAIIKDTDPFPDGVQTATLRWNGNLYPLTLSARSGDTWVGTTTLDFPVSLGSIGPYDWELEASDIYTTSDWLDSDRGWKIWNCEVPVTGTLFKALDAVQQCSTMGVGMGFFTPIDVGVSFSSIEFFNNPNRVPLSRINESSYGSPGYPLWSKNYLPLINGGDILNLDGDLLATSRVTRIIDLGSGTTSCPSSEFNLDDYISAYSSNPRAQVDFSYIRDQEGWFQVVGGGVKGRNVVQSGVPVTAPIDSRTLTISGVNNDNGLVSAANFEDNINGGCSECVYGRPNDWYVEQNTNASDIYSYQYFYNNFLLKSGVGVTGSNWGARPGSGIYFIDGDLTIDENHQLATSTETMMVVVRGGITITQDVTRLDGIYIADGTILTQGKSDTQLVINGMLYSGGAIVLGRSYEDKTANNTSPAVKINYSPNLIFNLPGTLMKILSGWREE